MVCPRFLKLAKKAKTEPSTGWILMYPFRRRDFKRQWIDLVSLPLNASCSPPAPHLTVLQPWRSSRASSGNQFSPIHWWKSREQKNVVCSWLNEQNHIILASEKKSPCFVFFLNEQAHKSTQYVLWMICTILFLAKSSGFQVNSNTSPSLRGMLLSLQTLWSFPVCFHRLLPTPSQEQRFIIDTPAHQHGC